MRVLTRSKVRFTGLAALGLAGLFVHIHIAVAGEPAAPADETLLPADPVLQAYVADALGGNLALRQHRLSVEEASAALSQARAQYLPTVGLEARASERYGAVLDFGKLINPAYAGLNQVMGTQAYPTNVVAALPVKRETKLVVTQPLFAPALLFQDDLRTDALAAERARWQVYARQLRADVQIAYFQHGRAVELVALLDRTAELLRENLRVSEVLFAAGKTTEDAVFRARAELAELAQRRDEAADGVAAARRYLNFLANRGLETPVPASPPLAPAPAHVSMKRAQAAADGREELVELAAGGRAARHEAWLARSTYLPVVGAAAEYGFQGDRYDFSLDKDYLVASLVLRWNLWSGFGDRARVRQAELTARRLDLQQEELRRQLALQVTQAWQDAETARRRIATAAERTTSARASYDIVSRRFRAGSAPPVELLDARTTLTRAETDSVVSTYDFAIRLVELERAAALAPERQP